MQPLGPQKRDPAPSRAAYRLQRLWLTPFFRFFLRIGLPVLLLVAVAGYYFAQPANRLAIRSKIAEIRQSIEERPEFMVRLMAIDGASFRVAEQIRETIPVEFPVSSFDLNLPDMQDQIGAIDAVARVDVRVRPGGILQVEVQERTPAVIWRSSEGLFLLDASGHRVAPVASRLERPDLPLLAGAGADIMVPQALELLATAQPVSPRIRGLVRVGERRWDLVLDRNQRILLPETDARFALEQVMALEEAKDLLARDLLAVDMRNKSRPTLRMAPTAVDEMRRIRTVNLGADTE